MGTGFDDDDIGKRFVVVFDSIDPGTSCLLHWYLLPDSVDAPLIGWSKLPPELVAK